MCEILASIKEVKCIHSSFLEIDPQTNNFISREDEVNKLLSQGWIILEVHECNYILGLPSNSEKSSKTVM